MELIEARINTEMAGTAAPIAILINGKPPR
jgi:hypothetical protein